MNDNDRRTRIRWGFKKAYVDAGFTLDKLSERAAINATYLSLFARGKYRLEPEQIERLALILDVPAHEIAAE